MNFKQAIEKCLRNFQDYNSRARRSEFWYFFLFDTIVVSVVNLLTAPADSDGTSLLARIASIVLLVPLLSVGSRRMHDIGKNGRLTFLQVIPLANLYFMYLCTKDSDPNANQYGPSPKYGGAETIQFNNFAAQSEKQTDEKEEIVPNAQNINYRPNAVNISDHVNGNVQNEPVEIPKQEVKDEIQACVEGQDKKPATLFCKNCGNPLELGDKFCNNCGAKIE